MECSNHSGQKCLILSHFSYLLSEVLNSKVMGNDKDKIKKFMRHLAWFLNHCGFALKYRQ